MNGQHKRNWQHTMRDGRKRWNKMPPARRAASIITVPIQVGLLVAALIDLRRRPAEQINGSKRLWMFLVFIYLVGPISYFVIGRKKAISQTSNEPAVNAVAGL